MYDFYDGKPTIKYKFSKIKLLNLINLLDKVKINRFDNF